MKQATPIEFTSRENEILNLLQRGCSNKEIATSLSISVNTVKFHLQNLYRKLEVSNRVQVLAACLRNNKVENPHF
jgi:DNA-binding NarL/FixJ family response regulator